MATASAILYSTKNDKKQARTISNINPNATNLQVKTFAQACNALTTRTYVETYKIIRINCDVEPDEEDNNNG